MNVPWLLIASGLAISVAAMVDPLYAGLLVLASPVLLVLVPVAFPTLERKINRSLERRIAGRAQVLKARQSRPSDPTAGLSLSGQDATGQLSVVDSDLTPRT